MFHCLCVHVFTGYASLENQSELLPTLRSYFIVHQGHSHVMIGGNQESQQPCTASRKSVVNQHKRLKTHMIAPHQQIFTSNEDLCHESREKHMRHIYAIW